MEQAIGIMGGSFNPIHYGHLLAAACAADEFRLEKVIFVPAAIPPHKRNLHLASEEDRYRMAVLATRDNPLFLVSDVEISRGGVSYTVDTLRYFKEQYPNHRIYFITGADTISEIHTWRSPKEVLQLAHFIVALRPGYKLEGLESEFYQRYIDRIGCMEMPVMGISSTEIRHRVKAGKTIRYQVHPEVIEYIRERGLYLNL